MISLDLDIELNADSIKLCLPLNFKMKLFHLLQIKYVCNTKS